MTTTEDLYQQANETYAEYTQRAALASLERAGLRAVVDLVLAARPDRQPWEVLREAADLIHPKSHPTGMWLPAERVLRDEAKHLEAERKAAQERAERDWETLRRIADESTVDRERSTLRALADHLEAEHQAAQEKAVAEAEREKLIEQAAVLLHDTAEPPLTPIPWEQTTEARRRDLTAHARALVDAGWRPAPESDGGEQA